MLKLAIAINTAMALVWLLWAKLLGTIAAGIVEAVAAR